MASKHFRMRHKWRIGVLLYSFDASELSHPVTHAGKLKPSWMGD
jgi:hypothetical protein